MGADSWVFRFRDGLEEIVTRGQDETAPVRNTSRVLNPLAHMVWRFDAPKRDQLRLSLTQSYRAPPTQNLVAFACDGRAFASLAGVPDGMTVMAQQLGVVQTLTFDFVKDPNTGIMMAAAKYQDPATGDLIWCPTFIYGTNAGKQGDTAVATNTEAQNSVLAAANANGTGSDYAGLLCSSGATTQLTLS